MRAATVDARAGARRPSRDWARGPVAIAIRGFIQTFLLLPFVRWLGRPLHVEGADRLVGAGPYVFVANHASHADTAAILAALPSRIRRRTAPAAAQDYFFSSALRGFFVTLLTGAFPFSRKGRSGLVRAESLLHNGWSIVLFPEGTRSCDGRVHAFKSGVAALAERGWTVVPVGVAGTADVLAKGMRIPRRSPVAVTIGAPEHFRPGDRAVGRLEAGVRALAGAARSGLPAPRQRLHDRVAAFARSRRGLLFCAGWGVAEALFWPVIPDFVVAPVALAAPGRALVLALGAIAGSVAGGALAFTIGATGAGPDIAAHLPLVTERMSSFAQAALSDGAAGLLGQPMSGVPYKAFAYQASGAGLEMLSFLWFSLLARGARLLAVAGLFAVVGVGARRVWQRVYGPFLVFYTACFGVGLARVVASWS